MHKVVRYKSYKKYERGVEEMTKNGWRVCGVVSENPRSGCMRIIMLGGIGALIWKPKPVMAVTYHKFDESEQ